MVSKPISIGILRSEFNKPITDVMLESARATAKRLGLRVVVEAKVPGAFDMPLVLAAMLQRRDVDGVAVIGAVIKGETKHDELITREVARNVKDLEREYGKPVGMGVMGPGITWEQARDRAKDYARRSVEAVASVHKTLRRVARKESPS